MATGFIYIIPTVGAGYTQPSAQAVPTWSTDRIYFGPCKKPMRPRMRPGDHVFGISPSGLFPRRIVVAARIAERMTFAEAYRRFPPLRGPQGPIHVRPVQRADLTFPDSEYEHIPGASHEDSWRSDILNRALDAFFVCEPAGACAGRWLGPEGPAVRGAILELLKSCKVFGRAGELSAVNHAATENAPIKHGKLYTGLHLETDDPGRLLKMICAATASAREMSGSGSAGRSGLRSAPSPRRSRQKC